MTIALAIGRWLLSGGWKYASMGLLAIALLFYRADAGHWKDRDAADRASIPLWQQTDRTNHATIDQLLAAITEQSAHVRALADAGQIKQQAAQAALRAATGRAVQAEGLAARIDAERAVRGSGCASGDAVMAARKAL